MSYNPTRALKDSQSKKVRATNPHAGTKHSQIIRKAGLGASSFSTLASKKTTYGFSTPILESKDFTVKVEIIGPGNNLGLGVNEKGDRFIKVLKNKLFIQREVEGELVVEMINPDHIFVAKQGTKYSLATSGLDSVELLIVESSNYQKNWKQLENPENKPFNFDIEALSTAVIPTRDRDNSKARIYGEQELAKRNSRARDQQKPKRRADIDSVTTVGTNLRPIGPGGIAGEDAG